MSKNLKVALVIVLVAAVAVVGFFYKEHKDSEATLSTTKANVAVHTEGTPSAAQNEEHAATPVVANETVAQTAPVAAAAPVVTTNAPVAAQPAPAAQTATVKK